MRLLRFARNDENSRIPLLCHCEALKKPKQSHSKFRPNSSVIAEIPSLRGSKATEAISFKIPSKIPSLQKFRHCERSEAISFKIPSKIPSLRAKRSNLVQNSVIAEIAVIASEAKQSHQIAIISSENSKILAGF